MPDVFHKAVQDFRGCFSQLLITSITYKLIAFIVLTPLVGILFRTILAASGHDVLSDVDIVFFFLGPLGCCCLIVAVALWLAVLALEQASLLGILAAKFVNKSPTPLAAIWYAMTHAWPVFQVTTRVVAWGLVAAAPFLAVAGLVYYSLLTEFDINYYLQERPPVFRIAVGVGIVLAIGLGAVLLRLLTGWLYALPLVLLEGVLPSQSLKESTERAAGHRGLHLRWIVAWFGLIFLLSTISTVIVGFVGHILVPSSTNSLRVLTIAVGITMLVAALGGLIVNLLSTTLFATLYFTLYSEVGSKREALQLDRLQCAGEEFKIKITRPRLAAGLIIGFFVAVLLGAWSLQSIGLEDNVLVMAHRGSSKAAPENTMAAFRQAIEDGADWIEIDVQETADGEVVVFHDSDFMKLARNPLKIWDATVEDLRDIDVGSWFDPQFSDQRVPLLTEVLDLCKGKVGVNIELKYYGHDEQLEQRVAQIVDSRDMASEILVMSLKMDGVKKMKTIRPDWNVGLLMSVSAGNLKKVDADFLAVNARFATSSIVHQAHSQEKQVFVWTVNDAPTMSQMIGRGVDGLLTDKPALARSVLQQRSEMSAPERLLLELASVLGTQPQIAEQ